MKGITGFTSSKPKTEKKDDTITYTESKTSKIDAFGAESVEEVANDQKSREVADEKSATSFSQFTGTQKDEAEMEDSQELLHGQAEQAKKSSIFRNIITESDDFEEEDDEEKTTFIQAQETGPIATQKFVKQETREPVHEKVEPEQKHQEAPVNKEKDHNASTPGVFDKAARKCKDAVNVLDAMNDHPMQTLAAGAGAIAGFFSKLLRQHSFNKMLKNGKKVVSGDFELVQNGNLLIVSKYTGVSSTVQIPSEIGNLPVRYINPDFLYSSSNPFDNYKMRSFKQMLKANNPEFTLMVMSQQVLI